MYTKTYKFKIVALNKELYEITSDEDDARNKLNLNKYGIIHGGEKTLLNRRTTIKKENELQIKFYYYEFEEVATIKLICTTIFLEKLILFP